VGRVVARLGEECENGYFEFDPAEVDWEPVKLWERWNDMVIRMNVTDKPCGDILHTLLYGDS
jgi:hypothetical protein